MNLNSISISATPTELNSSSLKMLLVYTFVMVVGFSMLMPLVAVHFVNNIGMTATVVGLALAVRQLTQQGLTIVGGILADRFGIRPMIGAGVLLRAIGFAFLAWTNSTFALFAALVVSAIGGALFEAPYQAAIATLTSDSNRQHYYLVSNVVGGIASTVGPLLGVLLLQFDFQLVCLSAAACFFLNFFIATLFLPGIKKPEPTKMHGTNLGKVVQDKKFVLFTGVMAGYWFATMQFNISFPLWAEHLSGSQKSVGVMYALSAAMTVILQYPLVKLFERWLDARHILVIGMIVISLGCFTIGFVTQFSWFLVSVVIFQLGVLLTRPTQQSITASLADRNSISTYMGFSSLGLAVGGGLGSLMGGYLMDIATLHNQPGLPWFVFSAVGIATSFFIWLTTQSSQVNPKVA